MEEKGLMGCCGEMGPNCCAVFPLVFNFPVKQLAEMARIPLTRASLSRLWEASLSSP